ncbi:MAG TPA: hypothetical protein VG294_02865 [Solirubrobacteraceae bacterium]|jgi:hypothetical protein|nr:hypothetical protein [Solirubrobacteraceae bacterium]
MAPSNHGWLLLAGGLLAAVLAFYRLESPPGTLDISLGPIQFPSPAGAGAALSHLVRVQAGGWVAVAGGAMVMLGGWSQLGRPQAASVELTPTYQ